MFCLTEEEGKRERRKLCPGVNFSLLGMPGRRGKGREEGGRENWTGNASKEALFHSPLPLPHLLKFFLDKRDLSQGLPPFLAEERKGGSCSSSILGFGFLMFFVRCFKFFLFFLVLMKDKNYFGDYCTANPAILCSPRAQKRVRNLLAYQPGRYVWNWSVSPPPSAPGY